ncbi:hypothetical protein KUTeg_002116 [Tegillarca granosa]|uniref:WW domain-containing protein n=1 Tax=Tegillarca granosa TaxID=220873 RepID=A0ABQ9FTE2_TEGGR|nr:hypothetical protein KUTeg_002116 [Tegillarca granosa]
MMVMHARKQPRLDDGYMEKRDTHLYQSSPYPSKNYSEGYEDRYINKYGSSSNRDRSPGSRDSPRYHNKASYIERSKDRMEKGTNISPGKKVNHTSSSASMSRSSSQNGGYSKDVKPRDTRDSRGEKDQKTEAQKSALRVCGDWSQHISSSGDLYYYNYKTAVSQWEKPKEWTDGSDGKSKDVRGNDKSHGSNKQTLEKSRHSSSSTSERTSDKYEHHRRTTSLEFNHPHGGKPDKLYLIEKLQASQYKLQAEMAKAANHPYSSSSSSSHRTPQHHATSDRSKSDHYNKHDSTGSIIDAGSANRSRVRRDSEGNRSHGHVSSRRHNDTNQNEDMDISPGSTPTSSRPSSCAGTPQIGPGSTPATQTIPSSAALALGHHHQSGSSTPLISSIPQLITQLSGGQNNQELTQKGINQQVPPQQSPRSTNDIPVTSATILSNIPTTYQTLKSPQHGPLQGGPHPIPQHISHQGSQQHVSTHQAGPPISGHHQNSYHTLTSPHHEPIIIQNQNTTSTQQLLPPPATIAPPHVQQHQASVYGRLSSQPQIDSDLHVENSKGGESPLSESSQRSSCASPSSTTSSQNALNVEASALSVAMKKESPATGMNSSLSNYYNERLIGHVLGWQADHAERQANRYAEEGITVGSFRCSQVSVELKRARSLVRLAEIQSTLHEQRLLFLDQQIHELESMKPPNFSSSHSFPSSSGGGGGGQ